MSTARGLFRALAIRKGVWNRFQTPFRTGFRLQTAPPQGLGAAPFRWENEQAYLTAAAPALLPLRAGFHPEKVPVPAPLPPTPPTGKRAFFTPKVCDGTSSG